MNYIINPSWFYWLNMVGSLREVSLGLAIAAAIIALILGLLVITDCLYDEDLTKRCCRLLKGLAIFTGIMVLLFVFLPSKNTLIEMQVARFATHENAEWTVDAIKSAVDYIIEAIKAARG